MTSTVASALARLSDALAGPINHLERLSGGASKETWRLEAGGRPLILRRSPGGGGDAIVHALPLATEASLIRTAGAHGVPVPQVVRVCRPEDGLGEAYVMTCLEGETLGKRIARDEAFRAVRQSLAWRCGQVLAALHAIPIGEATGLTLTDAAAVLDQYEATYRKLGARRPVMEAAFRWLKARAPKLDAPVLVHGDFRNGNLMVDPAHGLVAVLDWELAHLGDPAEDLGWICVNSWRFGGEGPVGGFGDYQDLLEGYAEAGGRTITLEDLLYWQAVGSLKWGVMCLMMYAAHASGADPSVERAMIGRRASEAEIDLVALMELAA